MASSAPAVDSSESVTVSSESTPKSSSSSPIVKRKPGRPCKASRCEPLVVTIEGKQGVLLTTRDDYKDDADEVLLSLRIPNRLLYEWYGKVSTKMEYLPLLNASIVDGVVAVSCDSEDLSQKLYRRAGKLSSDVKKLKGSFRESLLSKSFLLPIYQGDTISPQLLQAQVCELESELTFAMEELSLTQDAVTHMKDQLQKLIVERDEMVHSGKKIEDMSKRQRRRKLAHFGNAAESALWFAETFGLVPESVNVRTSGSREVISVPLSDSEQQQPSNASEERKVDEYVALQTLYLLDRFGVSDEFYHELTQMYPSLQRSHVVKSLRTKLF